MYSDQFTQVLELWTFKLLIRRALAVSLLSSSRTVLLMGDEGLHIYKISSKTAQFVRSVAWDIATFEVDVKNALIKQCGKSSVLILNDMVEQHYRKEDLPKISILDKSSVVKRRLSIAFPNYPIRAALKLKATTTNSASGGTYLFAAMPLTSAYSKTLAAIRMAGVAISGLTLLPVEGSAFVQTLSQKLAKKGKIKSKWSIFVGQHQGGGVRQIVTRNGELALTRMTPVVDTDVEPDLWVKEIASELQSTMSYLGRFGYKPIDGLDIFIVSGEESKDLLERSINIEANIHCLTSVEVAKVLGVNLAQPDDLRYADSIYAAAIASQRAYVLPMQNPALEKEMMPRRIAMGASGLLFLGALFLGYQSFKGWSSIEGGKNKLALLKQEKSNLQIEYDKTLRDTKIPGYDLLLVKNTIDIYKGLPQTKDSILQVIKNISDSLGGDLKLSNLVVKTREAKRTVVIDPYAYDTNAKPEEKSNRLIEAVAELTFSYKVDTEEALIAVNKLRDDLAKRFTNYDVTVIKQVGNLSYTGSIVGETKTEFEGNADNAVKTDYTAEILIKEKL